MKQINFWGNKNVIGKQLSFIRQNKNISQSELAAKMQVLNVNIDQQMISKIEKNKRQVTDYEFACLCICLEVTPVEMLEDFKNCYFKDKNQHRNIFSDNC